jgi:hypothetical protein
MDSLTWPDNCPTADCYHRVKMRFSIPLSILFAAAIACVAETPAARWEGAIQVPGREIKLVIDLAQNSGGQWIGSAIVPGFEIKGAALSEIAVKDSSVSFAIKGALGDPKFEGRLTPEGALTGEFKQAGNAAPFSLRRVGPAQVELPPASTAVRSEFVGDWKGDMSYLGNPIHVTIKLANESDGKATGQLIIIGKKETTLPIDLVTQEGEMLTVEMYERGMTYEGRYVKGRNEINGEFRQGGIEIPLVLHPAAKI